MIVCQKYFASVELAQTAFVLLLLKLVIERHNRTLFESILLCCLLLHSETNVISILVLLCYLHALKPVLCAMPDNTASVIIWLVAKSSFFYLGNSNGLATINVGAGYTGLTGYSPVIVTVLLAVHTYSGPLIVYSYCLTYWDKGLLLRTYFWSTWSSLLVFSLLCVLMRYHIFVWTVFSPKLLYFGMELVVFSVFITMYSLYETYVSR